MARVGHISKRWCRAALCAALLPAAVLAPSSAQGVLLHACGTEHVHFDPVVRGSSGDSVLHAHDCHDCGAGEADCDASCHSTPDDGTGTDAVWMFFGTEAVEQTSAPAGDEAVSPPAPASDYLSVEPPSRTRAIPPETSPPGSPQLCPALIAAVQFLM